MGRAIVRNPKAFLMDEPLSNLDAKLRVQMRSEIARLQNKLGTTTVYVTHDQTEAMTLGDRVVVLLAGEVQQIGTPEELYNRPANLFVAGFIGSPAMNFFPATITDVGVRLPFGEVTLTQEVHDLLARHQNPNNVIVGIRPEHLEDASVLDGYARIRALTFDVTVDMVESLGADKYLHFKSEGAGAQAAQLAELASESGVGENEFVARVSTESQAKKGDTIQLAFDTSKLTIFDADTGKNLTASTPRRLAPAPRRRPSDRRPGEGPRAPARALRQVSASPPTPTRPASRSWVPRRSTCCASAPICAPSSKVSFTMCRWGVRDIRCSIRPSW